MEVKKKKVPVADYRNYHEWLDSERYKELLIAYWKLAYESLHKMYDLEHLLKGL